MPKREYTHPDVNIARAQVIHLPATAASTIVTKFIAFAKMRVKSVNGAVLTAGTNDTAGYQLLNGAAEVANVVTGTVTAGSALQGTTTAAAALLEEGAQLDIKTKANSGTLASVLVIEYQLTADADVL